MVIPTLTRSQRRRNQRRRVNQPWIKKLRQEGTCSWCGAPGTAVQLQAHHIVPSRKAYRLQWNRTRTGLLAAARVCCWLCGPCHTAVHQGVVPVGHPDFRPIVEQAEGRV
jgi:hypothetical protein